MQGTHEKNEYRKNTKTNFTLSAKKKLINQTSSDEMGGKYGLIHDKKMIKKTHVVVKRKIPAPAGTPYPLIQPTASHFND
jgi:hypothetical protein